MASKQDHLVRLSCNHVKHYPPSSVPEVGDVVSCLSCPRTGTRKLVLGSVVMEIVVEYKIKCLDCTYARAFGAAKINAELAAVRHRQKTRHKIRVMLGTEILATLGRRDAERILELPLENVDDKPPF